MAATVDRSEPRASPITLGHSEPRASPITFAQHYVGDGGPALQRLWDHCAWREIRNCPGRFTAPRSTNRTSPAALLQEVLGAAAPPLVTWDIAGKDPILLARLPGGGGLLSYAKAEAFVHTLNTESGLLRKVEALKMPLDALAFASARDRQNCACVLAVISFLDDRDTNAAAYALVRRLRRTT